MPEWLELPIFDSGGCMACVKPDCISLIADVPDQEHVCTLGTSTGMIIAVALSRHSVLKLIYEFGQAKARKLN